MNIDPDRRIEELEGQVRELSRLVQQLATDKESPCAEADFPPPEPAKARQIYKEDARRNLDKILGGEAGDTLETRIGGIWLSRVAMVLVMTTIVIGARATLSTDLFGPGFKLLAIYAGAIAATVYGLLRRHNSDYFPQTLLGAGLAGLYFATYGAFFTEGLRVFTNPAPAIPLLLACLAVLVAVGHWTRSQTAAGISLFLVYYTVVASCMGGGTAESLEYALLTIGVLALVAVMFHAMHQWLLFTWVALVASYVTYLFYFATKPPGLDMPELRYFGLSAGILTVCYVSFSLACVIDARKTGEYRRTVAPMSGVNSFVYFCLMWVGIRKHLPEFEWEFRLGAAVCLLLFAILAETTGPRRNYLFQIFIAKAVIMLTLALQAYLSGEKLVVAMAIECLALAFSFKRSGAIIFKVLGLLLLLITFVSGIVHVKTPGVTSLLGFAVVPSNWFCGVGSALAFLVTAWFYEQYVRRVRPEHRIVSGQWFLADTFIDVSGASMALLHAAIASLLLLTLTIIDLGTNPNLPYLLAFEGLLMAVAGFLIRTPQVEVGGVLLLVAAHVCYHAFLLLGIPEFEQQVTYPLYTALVVVTTYCGAYLWERYLRRIQGGKAWEHHAIASIPYLAATFMLTTLLARTLPGIQVPLAQNGAGVVLLLMGVLLGLAGIKASGVLAFGFGTAGYYMGLYSVQDPFARQPVFLLYSALFLVTYAVAERLLAVLERQEQAPPSPIEDMLRWVFVALGAALGTLALKLYCNPRYLTLYWLGLAVMVVTLGAVFRESRYRWAAIALFAVMIARAFAYDLRELPPVLGFLSFAPLALVLLVITWGYSRYRQRTLKRARDKTSKDARTHE